MPSLSFIKKPSIHDVPVTVKLTNLQFKNFKEKCDKLNLSMSYVIRFLISEWLEDNLRQINQ